jgi:hypothetical protein
MSNEDQTPERTQTDPDDKPTKSGVMLGVGMILLLVLLVYLNMG